MADADTVRALLNKYAKGKWVKLTGDGEVFEGFPLGEPWGCEVVGFGKDTRRYDPAIHSGGEPRFQGWFNVVDRETKQVRILPLGVGNMRRFLNDRDAGTGQHWYTYTRIEIGEKNTDVRYKIGPKKEEEEPISDAEHQKLLKLLLWDLEEEAFSQGGGEKEPSVPNPHLRQQSLTKPTPAPPAPPAPHRAAAPKVKTISAQMAHDIWKEFEPLPSDAWTELHQQLEITDIKQLTEDRLDEVQRICESIKRKLGPPPPPKPGPMGQDAFKEESPTDIWGDGA
jgi:hypothetical protein